MTDMYCQGATGGEDVSVDDATFTSRHFGSETSADDATPGNTSANAACPSKTGVD
jgi:hypothetical protein